MLNVSQQRVSQLRRSDFPPPFNDAGGIAWADAGRWIEEHYRRKFDGGGKPATRKDEADIALTRKNTALAEKTELEVAVRRGELIEASVAEQSWQDVLMRVKTRLLQIPSVVVPHVAIETDPNRIHEIIDDGIRDALSELADGVRVDVPFANPID